MARLIPQKQIEEVNIFRDSISVGNSVFISGSLLVSQSIDIGNDLTTPQRITGSVQITGSINIDGDLTFARAESRLDATASFSDVSVDTQRFGGIPVAEFGGSDSTIYVSATRGDDSNDGRSPQFPVRTIKRAAQIVTPGDDGRYGLPTGSNFTGFRIDVQAGTYLEDNPIELPRNTTVWGAGLRVSKVVAKNENEDLFWVNSGNYLAEMTFAGLRVFPSVDDSQKGFAISFAPNAFITTSPYIQNCSMISNQENSFLEAYEDIPAGGGGLNVDGNRIHPDSPLASMVLDAYTQVAPNGVGCQVVGRGFIQLVSFFTNFSAYSVKVIDGGQAVLLNSNTSFGDFGMYASGSRFITGSGGNTEAFLNVQDNYSIIVDTIERGLGEIPDLVTNTEDGIKVTNELQKFNTGAQASDKDAKTVVSDYRLISNLIERGVENKIPILAVSSDRGYNSGSVWNVSGDNQITSSTTASEDDLSTINTNYDIVLDIIERGNAATSSYIYVDNVSSSIKVTGVDEYKTSAVTDDTKNTISSRFDTVISIIRNGVDVIPNIETNTSQSYKVTDTFQYITDLSASLEVREIVSASFSTVYNILDNGTGSAPTIIESSSFENPTIDYQNAYTLLKENIPFIQKETIAYLSSSWSEFYYSESKCERDLGYIVSGAAHDLLFGGNEESVRNGNFYYLYPSEATTIQKSPTLTAIKYAAGIVDNILADITFQETTAEVDNAYELLFENKRFIQSESIAYLSSSWSTFDYNEAKCVRDIGYIIDAVATDIKYGGNERSVIAGNFYYKYPSNATVNFQSNVNGQLNQTIDGINYAKRLAEKLVKNETFVTQSSSTLEVIDTIFENRSLIQNETIAYINTTYPNFSYNEVKCKRDTGYILDAVLTDLKYGGVERTQNAGLYYFSYPSIANTTQLEETLEGIRYSKGFVNEVAKSNLIEIPSQQLNINKRIKVGDVDYVTSSISGTDFESKYISGSVGIVEDIIRFGNDSILAAIAENTGSFDWSVTSPLNVSEILQVTASVSTSISSSIFDDISGSFDTVIKIIESGSSIVTEETIGTGSAPVPESQIGDPISTIGIPKDSYGDGLVKTVITTSIPTFELTENTDSGIKFGSDTQITGSITSSVSESLKVSSSFSDIIDIIRYGTSGSLSLSGSFDTSTYYEVVTPETGDYYIINRAQLDEFDGVRAGGYFNTEENTGSFSDGIKDPTLTLKRGEMYTFSVNALKYDLNPFYIKTARKPDKEALYNEGVTNNGVNFGTLTFIVPLEAPNRLYYVNGNNVSASGIINVVDNLPISDTQRYIEVPSKGFVEITTNNVDNIKISNISQYSSSFSASVDESHEISSSFATTIEILKNGVDDLPTIVENTSGSIKVTNTSQITSSITPSEYELNNVSSSYVIVIDVLENGMGYTPTNATYDPATGDFVMTIENHSYSVSDSIYLRPESFTFTCDMDGNRTEHNLPSVGQIAYTNKLPITSVTDNTITVNVGASGPNVEFNPTNATYDPATGDFVVTVASHSLSVGEGIVMEPESFAFTCDMDNNQSVKSYPRVGIDPKAVRSIPLTAVTDTTMTFNVGASGPNKYFTPVSASYNALSGDMTLTVTESFGLGVGRSVVLENESFAFTCDQDGDSSVHSYPRPGSDPYAGKSIVITSVGTTSHTVTDAPYNASNGDVTITIAGHGFSNGDYIKLDDNSLTYTCVLDGNVTQKSYPRPNYDYPSGRWLEISNVTTNTFDINIGSSSYVGSHTFITASVDGLERQDGTFTINVGDAGSASGSLHTFVSASNGAVKHEPQSVHTFVSASNGALKHLPQSAHTFVRTTENSVSSLPNEIHNTSASIKVTDVPQYISSSVSGTLENVSFVSSSVSIVYNMVQLGTSGSYTASLYDTGSGPQTDESTIAAYEIIRNNISFIQSESLAYLSSSWSTASYDEVKCGRDIGLIISGAAEDLIWGTVSSSVVNGKFYLEYPSQAETSQLNQTLDGIEYASKITQKLIQNIEFVEPSTEASASHQLLLDNKLLIQNETIEYISSSWSDFVYSDILCRRDIGHIIDAAATDILYGGNERSVQAASFYYSNPSAATGSQLNQTVDAINYARRISNKILQNEVLQLPELQTLGVAELISENRSLIQEETIQFLSSSWSTFEYNEAKCRRDTGYIIDAVVTDFVYGGNERAVNAGEFYYLYPSDATGSQLVQTIDGITYAQRLTNKLINNTTLVTSSLERLATKDLLIDNKELIQNEVIHFISSSWSTFDYIESKCKRDVGYIIDAIATDVVYGGNERSVVAGEFYYRYPSEATTTQLDQTITGVKHAAGLSEKIIQNTLLVNPDSNTLESYNRIRNNRSMIQSETVEFIDSLYPYFTYDREKCKRDTGFIIDAVATDLLWGGNERSIIAGDYYYRYPSQATTFQLRETVQGIRYAETVLNSVVLNEILERPKIIFNSENNIKVDGVPQYSGSMAISGSNLNEISSSFEIINGIISDGIKSFTPTNATYDTANGDFVMTIPNHTLTSNNGIYLKPNSFTFTCDMDGNRTEHILPSIGQPAYNNRLQIQSVTTNTVTVNVGKSGPNIEFNPTNASYDPATGDFVITVASHSLSVGEGIVLSPESFAFTCDMDDNQSTKSYPRVGIDPFSVRSIPITEVTETTMTVNVGASGPNKYFTPVSASYNALSGDMILTVTESFGLGVGRSVVLEDESFAFTCDQDGDATTHSYPRPGSDPYAGKSIVITSVGTTSHTVTDAPYDSATGDVTITIPSHGFSNGDYIKLDDNSLAYTCVLDGNVTLKSYPRPAYDYPSGRWLEISNVTTNTFDINIGSSPYVGAHTFVSASVDGLERQDGTFTINVGDAGSASGSLHTFVSASNRAVKHEPQSLHTFVSASDGAVKHLPQSAHTFIRTQFDSVSTLPYEIKNVNSLTKVTDTLQVTQSYSGSETQIGIISASIDMINDIIKLGSDDIPFTIAKHFQTSELDTPQQLTTSSYVTASGDYNVTSEKTLVSESFSLINDIIENTTSSIDDLVDNAYNNRKFTNTTQYSSSVSASVAELSIVENRFGIVSNIVENGLSQKPSIIRNNTDIDNLIKVTNTPQYISSSAADKLQAKIISSSVAIVTDIIENGSGSAPNIIEYTTPSDSPKAKLAYQLLRNNLEFIKEETVAYISSSWSTFEYDDVKCKRDVGLIISGAAEDLIWNSNSASVVNGKFYLEYPSQATGSQLQQTLDGINYASTLAQHIVRNRTFVTASAEVSASYNLLFENKEFIQNETIAYLSSSWSDFYYSESKCKRDIGYIVDAVATDLKYNGNERSVIAGDYYYRYPSAAIVGGVPNVDQQKDPTVTGINYAKSLALELISGSQFVTASNEVEFVYDSIRENREFIQAETVAFVNAKYPNLQYNEASCSRDTGFIVDAVATDLRWGGNQRSIVAGQYYYKFPSKATTSQLGETTDAVIYASRLVSELIDKNTLPIPSASLNVDNNIKVMGGTQYTGSISANQSDVNFISSSIDIVTTIVANGTGSYETAGTYVSPSTNPNTLAAYEILRNNIGFIQSESIAYLSSSWADFSYNESKCSRDIGLIISGAAEDLVWNVVSASIVNGKFYYEYPSQANGTGSQVEQTLDGIFYASRLAQKLVQNIEFVEPSTEASSSWELIRSNKQFIKDETIAYLSSSWSDFVYNEASCSRDIGHVINAVATDILYGGNERSVIAGNYYYKYPSSATTTQLNPTTTGINYAGDIAENVIVNNVFETASAEKIAGNQSLLNNRTFIQSESLAYLTASWSTFEYDKDKCARDVGHIVDAVATDFLYGGNERSRVAGEFYYLYPSEATTTQVNQTTDGIKYAGRISDALVQNIQFVTASTEVSASFDLLRKNKPFIAEETIQYVSSSWSGVYYDEAKCRRDTGYIIDAAATDLLYGGNERSVIAGNYYFLYPSAATERGTPSVVSQLDPTTTGVKYASGLAQNVVQNVEWYAPSASVLVAADLLVNNKTFIQKETIAFLSSSWSEFPYNEVSCSRDLGYIIDAVRTDLVYGGNERSIQAATFYYYIPSVAITEQKPQTIDGIDFAKGMAEKVIKQDQLTFAGLNRRTGYNELRAAKKYLQSSAISYTEAAFPGFEYNEEKCYRDTGFILDAISTDLLYGGNERSIEAAKSYYNGVYGDASVVINEQKKETAETNRYLRTLFQKVARNAPLELFGSLIITTGHDFSYAGSGVTYKALPPNQGGNGVPDPDKEIVELGGGRVFFTAGNELGDFKIGTGLVINQATGTLQGRTFSRSLFSLVTPFSLALEG
jgi:hypothetical protein